MVSRAFAPLIGQRQAIELLTQAVIQHRVAPAYWFAGPDGVGRSLAAACFLALLLRPSKVHDSEDASLAQLAVLQQRIQDRNHPDLLWVEPTYLHQGRRIIASEATELGLKRKAPPQIRLEQIRGITEFLSRPPLEATRSVVVLEQAETMAEAAANALLKTLEEPGQATLILLAPDGDGLLPTLISRCQRIPFYRLSQTEMADVLTRSQHTAVLNHPEILAIAQGSPGLAIASWQQLQQLPAELLTALQQPPASLQQALDLARQIDQTLDTEAQLWLVDYLQHCYWQQTCHPVGCSVFLHYLEQARRYLLAYVQPRLVWEVFLMDLYRNATTLSSGPA